MINGIPIDEDDGNNVKEKINENNEILAQTTSPISSDNVRYKFRNTN